MASLSIVDFGDRLEAFADDGPTSKPLAIATRHPCLDEGRRYLWLCTPSGSGSAERAESKDRARHVLRRMAHEQIKKRKP